MTPPYRLYGMPASLYTAKARACLRKQHIDFEELPVGDPRFAAIVAQVGRFIMPVLETPAGEIIQDSAAIIDHLEAHAPVRLPITPTSPRQQLVSLVFELFGGEGLLRPAMHYRWNFDAENLDFLRRDFGAALAPAGDATQQTTMFDMASGMMRKAASFFGVSPETQASVEASYLQFLDLFDAHLATSPYLLGGHPTIGDYGLIAPLHAHLSRDPAPARLMKSRAWRVWRWVERMTAPEAQLDGFAGTGEVLLPDDAIPPSLCDLMRYVAEDYLPELVAHVAFANDWLAARPDLPSGSNGLDQPGARAIGMARFAWRGHEIGTAVMPYRFWLLQRLQARFDALASADRDAVEALFAQTGLSPLLHLKTARRVARRDHLEVWE